jgi:hypothetical protein
VVFLEWTYTTEVIKDCVWIDTSPLFSRSSFQWASCHATHFFQQFLSKVGVLHINMFHHGCDATGFEVGYQTLPTPGTLSKNCRTSYGIVAHNASHNFRNDCIYISTIWQIQWKCLRGSLWCPCMVHAPSMPFQEATFQDDSKQPPCSHILHTCQPKYSSQRHPNAIQFE